MGRKQRRALMTAATEAANEVRKAAPPIGQAGREVAEAAVEIKVMAIKFGLVADLLADMIRDADEEGIVATSRFIGELSPILEKLGLGKVALQNHVEFPDRDEGQA